MHGKKIVLGILLLASAGLAACGPSAVSSSASIPVVSSSTSAGGSASSFTPIVDDDTVHIILLAGQSGARGKGLNADLTAEEKVASPDVDILADGLMMAGLASIPAAPSSSAVIEPVRPGLGDTASECGPEIGMAETLASRYPKNGESFRSVIVKYTASGSTFYDHWMSSSLLADASVTVNAAQARTNSKTGLLTGPLTNNLYQLLDAAESTIASNGYKSVVDGCVFLHGEQDAKYDADMAVYKKALEYFRQDLRSYVGNPSMPFVIPEAHTNSAKYSNELRTLQEEVAAEDPNSRLVKTDDLPTNTFEPWHFSASSNVILGNRAAAELIAFSDTRVVTSFAPASIDVPLGVKVTLPAYETATFKNGSSGDVKVVNGDYDPTKEGTQNVAYSAGINGATFTGTLAVNVVSHPYVDGAIEEASYGKKNALPDSFGTVQLAKSEDGLYVGALINDTDLWTDGENWAIGDMGQYKRNDDFEVFLTDKDDASFRYTVAVSSAGLLRVYDQGISLTDSDATLASNNLYYHKIVTNFVSRAITFGVVNGGVASGLAIEIYIPFDDLGVDGDSLKLCFKYSNITGSVSGDLVTKTETPEYLLASGGEAASGEKAIANYFALSDLI